MTVMSTDMGTCVVRECVRSGSVVEQTDAQWIQRYATPPVEEPSIAMANARGRALDSEPFLVRARLSGGQRGG